MDKQQIKDNLAKLETRTDSALNRVAGWCARLAASPHTIGIIAVLIVVALISWAALR